MTWNYRVCKETFEDEIMFNIREVYYNKSLEISTVQVHGAAGFGNSVEDVVETLQRMLYACELPVVDLDTLVFAEGGW